MFWDNFFADNAKFSSANFLEEQKEKNIVLEKWEAVKEEAKDEEGDKEGDEANNQPKNKHRNCFYFDELLGY